jgi:hypothetical protein
MATEPHPGPMNIPIKPAPQPVTEKIDARQGVAVNQVRYMLYIGIPVVIIGFIIAYFWATSGH